jgi:hypothetical protein
MRFRNLIVGLLLLVLGTPALADMPECFNVFPSTSITATTDSAEFNPRWPAGYLRVSISGLGASQTVTTGFMVTFPTGSLLRQVDVAATALSANGDSVYAVGTGVTPGSQTADSFLPFGSPRVKLRFTLFNANNATIIADWCPIQPGA